VRVEGNSGQYLEIERSKFENDENSTDDDLLLNVMVDVGGYSAADQSWVVDKDWNLFMSQLRDLERTRQGLATLVGALSKDLRLVFQSTDRSGHMAITGHLGCDDSSGFSQNLEFGFSFDPGMLRILIQEFEALG
jgi:hypothetical protein